MRISVIAPSYLGFYDGCASNREEKFERAVNSFLSQNYFNKELIVISDGCEITNHIIRTKFNQDCIKLICLPKQPMFSGTVRQAGLNNSTGDFITYLDTDDFYSQPNHLEVICNALSKENIDWVYFDDIMKWNPHISSVREVKLEQGSVGTSNIAHKKLPDLTWEGKNHYGHDWTFIFDMIRKYPNKIKIEGTSYTVCHIPNVVDV